MKEKIEKAKQQYEAIIKKGGLDYQKFTHYFLTYHTTSMEGATLSLPETMLLLEENLMPQNKPFEHCCMVLDHLQALEYVLALAEKKIPLTENQIQTISSLLMKQTGGKINSIAGSFDSSKGEYRKLTAFAGTTTFPSYQKVPKMVAELLKYLNDENSQKLTEKQVYDLSFEAHYHFVSIHPFADGNGRLARLLMNYIQHLHQQPISVVFSEDKKDYIQALTNTKEREDLSFFKEFMYSQLEKFFVGEITKLTEKKKG